MRIAKNSIALIYYTVKDKQTGKVLQQISDEKPEEFLFGHELLIEVFEQQLLGKAAGDEFRFEAAKENAYGPVDPSAIFDLPLETFAEENGEIDEEVVQVGHVFPMADKEGNRHYGKIIRKMKDRVTMDFNHPMAGKDLIFEGAVVSIRAAEPDEIPPVEQ
ncbi:MAG: FKBP-type peptidyl-prolyl cis-trans isomerase [Bacteroidetes bacterium]|nr:FKBP-type peptidyl-prolyl cis-trans isomerase [Bacteroidota bacterium]MBU1579365.1 FKBP-type peptidyl-prolyl cis-trans isomerase [Bacteroidota bacterium]MBU2466970.1 FKBP-type peptidyl-prolyl cis-trans isomerase [Bacteroidota bacterium]MBU2558859.1 FKBP-type peptidyl-prolyl cis-trans isomerase [Bacteroidota bacterium]